jgi:hypothetical protein
VFGDAEFTRRPVRVLLGKRTPDGSVASPLDLSLIRRPRTPVSDQSLLSS